jgi:tripeptide aminopeptidase
MALTGSDDRRQEVRRMGSVDEYVRNQTRLVEAVFRAIDESRESLVGRIRELAEIPSPTFEEERRTEYVKAAFAEAGLSDVHSLPKGSVLGFTHSKNEPDTLLLAAHIDTVFPLETDLTTRLEGNILHGPGTGDNAANVAAIITLAEILDRLKIKPGRGIAFCGTVCEEGVGNLGGIAEVLEATGGTACSVIAVDGRMPYLSHRSLAIRRYSLKATGPGGHAWTDFGTPSAVHEVARIVSELASTKVPEEPKTTFNVGTIEGGTSVNAIAEECVAQVEFRSLEAQQVESMARTFLELAERIPAAGIRIETKLIGTRPAAHLPPESELVQTVVSAGKHVGIDPEPIALSTDAALPLSRGIPSISCGTYRGKGGHTLKEQIEVDSLATGLKWLALTVMVLAGPR